MKWSATSVLLWVLSFYCAQSVPTHLEILTHLPKNMKENSGLEVIPDSDLVWMINDSGNKDHLYGINIQGKIVKEFNIKGAVNDDWEDIAADEEGNIYIADIGNNSFNRNELIIYKLPNPAGVTADDLHAEEIVFTYPGQKKDQPYNAEAIICFEEKLYVFTKHERKNNTGHTRVFSLPAKPGTYTATPVTDITTCEDSGSCRITAADISPDGKTLALLSYGKIWMGPNFLANNTDPNLKEIDLEHLSQKEGLCFYDNETLYLSDERNPTGGGILYRLKPESIKPKE